MTAVAVHAEGANDADWAARPTGIGSARGCRRPLRAAAAARQSRPPERGDDARKVRGSREIRLATPKFGATRLDREEVAHPFYARESVVRATYIVDIDRRRRAPQAAGLENDDRLGAAGRAGDHDDAPTRGPFDLTHDPTGEAVLAICAGELRESFGVDQRPIHGHGTKQTACQPVIRPNSLGGDA